MSRLIAWIPPPPRHPCTGSPECLVQVDPKQLHEVPAVTVLLARTISINFISAGSFICTLYIPELPNKCLNKPMIKVLTPDMAREAKTALLVPESLYLGPTAMHSADQQTAAS